MQAKKHSKALATGDTVSLSHTGADFLQADAENEIFVNRGVESLIH